MGGSIGDANGANMKTAPSSGSSAGGGNNGWAAMGFVGSRIDFTPHGSRHPSQQVSRANSGRNTGVTSSHANRIIYFDIFTGV